MTPQDWIVIVLLVVIGSLASPTLFAPSKSREDRDVRTAILVILLIAAAACGLLVQWAVKGR